MKWPRNSRYDATTPVAGAGTGLRFAMRDSFVMVANGTAWRRLVDGQAAA